MGETVRRCCPHSASAELTGHLISSSGDIFISSTITLDFTNAVSREVANASKELATPPVVMRRVAESHPMLLLTLSPLHRIRQARLLISKVCEGSDAPGANATCDSDIVSEWHELQLNEQTLYATDRVSAESKHHVAQPSWTPLSTEEYPMGGELELDIGGDSDDTVEPECDDKFEKLFILELVHSAVSGVSAEDSSTFCVLKLCVDIVVESLERLQNVSYPRFTVTSKPTVGQRIANACFAERGNGTQDESDDNYILLVGQHQYEYYICPRIEYANGHDTGSGFAAVDVNVVSISPLQEGDDSGWEVVLLSPLPSQPADLLCAFVRSVGEDTAEPSVEVYNGAKWLIQQYPAYTHMKAEEDAGHLSESLASSIYFFHCDHAIYQYLMGLLQIADFAWTAAVNRATASTSNTWVVARSDGKNALLSLRRGFLCTRHAVLLSDETLYGTVGGNPAVSPAVALRGKTAVISAALELKWKATHKDNASFPELLRANKETSFLSVGSALLRTWSLCLLSDVPGWTEFLHQERQIALYSLCVMPLPPNSWCLPQQYVREVYVSLLLLSSAFVVTVLRQNLCGPWELLRKGVSSSFMRSIGVTDILPTTGMHLDLVRLLILRDGWGKCRLFDATSLSSVCFVGTLSYEEKLRQGKSTKDEGSSYHDIHLHITVPPTKRDVQVSHILDQQLAEDAMWLVDLPFTVLYFVAEYRAQTYSTPSGFNAEAPSSRCRVAHMLPCYWRVSALDWARGLSQHASFTLLRPSGDDGVGATEGSISAEGCGDKEGNSEGQDGVPPLLIPFLVLNPKVVPQALFLHVDHSQFFTDLSEKTGFIMRQSVLQNIMEESVREGEEDAGEVDMLFTPLLNQLLLSILDATPSHSPVATAELLPIQLFEESLEAVSGGAEAVWGRVYADTRVRLMRRVGYHRKGGVNSHSLKRSRDNGTAGYGGGCHESLRLLGNIQSHIQTIAKYQSTLPQLQLRSQRRRPLVLRLYRERTGSSVGVQPKGKEQHESNIPRSVSDLAQLVSRVMCASATRLEEGESTTARRAVDSLLFPLWLLLLDLRECGVTTCGGQVGTEVVRRICEVSFKGLTTNGVVLPVDTFLLEAYQFLMQDA